MSDLSVLLLVLAAGTIAWWFIRRSGQQQAATQMALEQWSLEFSERGTVYHYEANLPRMELRSRIFDPGSFADAPNEQWSLLRRSSASEWSHKLTEESLREWLKWLDKCAREADPDLEDPEDTWADRIREARKNDWEPLPERVTASLEVAYQRYLQQRR